MLSITLRSSRAEVFCKKGVRPATLLKKTLAQVFACEFVKFLRTPISIEHLWWLSLYPALLRKVIVKYFSFFVKAVMNLSPT